MQCAWLLHKRKIEHMQEHLIQKLGFYGPARKDPYSGANRRRQHYMSLVHWMEWHKLDAAGLDEIRSETLLMPSIKEVVKFSKANKAKWRTDWSLVRTEVLLQGLAMMRFEHPQSQIWDDLVLRREMLELGFSPLHVENIAAMHQHRQEASKVVFLGASQAPNEEVNRRIRNLQKRMSGRWQLAHWMGRHASWSVHDWADANRMGISYLDSHSGRLTGKSLASLAQMADHFILFEKRGSRSMDGIAAAIKRWGKTCDTASWTESQAANLDLF